jgi:iron complex outermembrane recepter protein
MSNRLPFRLTSLALALSVALPMLASAADAPAAPDASTPETKSLDTVIVTGTRSTTRTEADSLSPIDVLTPADLHSSGSTDLASALASLLPSLDFPRPAINDGNDALRPATLRGLSPDQVLVLVDGKRYHTSALVNYNYSVGRGSAPVDLNSIPMSAIDHIEVLRDGASAQYGSDAIAGVINIVLKHGAKEGSNNVSINGGGMSKGDGAQNGADGSFGIPIGTADASGNTPGWARLSLNYQNAMNTNRAGNSDRSTTIVGNAPASGPGYERYGDPAVVTYQALGNFGYTFSPDVEAYGYLNASRRDVTSNGFYRYYNSARNVPEIYPNGFLPQIVNHTNDLNGVFGLRGTLENGWHWDVSADYGKNHLVFDIQDSLNANLYHSLGYSPTYFNAGTFANTQEVLNIDLSKDFTVGFLPNPVTFAWGLEYRKEKYDINAGEPDSYYFNPATLIPGTSGPYAGGSQVFPGLSPLVAGDWTRHNEAAYVDFETNLTDKLSVGLAARYEDYSDAGATRSGKLSALYHITDTLALRGTISNGFRAPSLAQENYESITTLIQNGVLAQIGTYRTSDPVAIALGAKPLTPEKSTNYSFGTTWTPFENFTSSLDIYQIHISNEILYSDQLAVSIPNSQVQGAQFFVNGATTRTRGADLTAGYSFDLDAYGELKLTASGNWNQTSILSVSDDTLFGRASQGLLTYGTPRTKYVFGGDWVFKGFDFHANMTRYGAVTRLVGLADIADSGAADQKFAARWLLDINATYNWNAWTFTVGADNLTNQYPTKVNEAVSNGFGYEDIYDGLQYSALSPFGMNGRYVYGKIGFKF